MRNTERYGGAFRRRVGIALISTLVFMASSVIGAAVQVRVQEQTSTASTVTAEFLTEVIVSNARVAAGTAAANAKIQTEASALSPLMDAHKMADNYYYSAEISAFRVYWQASQDIQKAATKSMTSAQREVLRAEARANYNQYEATRQSALNTAREMKASADRAYYAKMTAAVSTAVQEAVASSIAETISQYGVSVDIAKAAMQAANPIIGAPAFSNSLVNLGPHPTAQTAQSALNTALQSSLSTAGNNIATALVQAATIAPPGSTATDRSPPPPTPLIVVYRR